MERLKANMLFVQKLCKTKGSDKTKSILKKPKLEEIKTLVDLSLNILNKNIPVRPKDLKCIKANRRILRHLVHPQFSLKSKRKYLIQKGGGGNIFTMAGRAIASLFGRGAARAVAGTSRAPL